MKPDTAPTTNKKPQITMALGTVSLVAAAVFDFSAALLHLACIPWGAAGFRALGAGEPIARMAERGHWYPHFVAVLVAVVLTVWGTYALSGAGFVRPLPFLREVLGLISAIFLLRSVAFPLLNPLFPGNSATFWWVSSSICLLVGLAHAVGAALCWKNL